MQLVTIQLAHMNVAVTLVMTEQATLVLILMNARSMAHVPKMPFAIISMEVIIVLALKVSVVMVTTSAMMSMNVSEELFFLFIETFLRIHYFKSRYVINYPL